MAKKGSLLVHPKYFPRQGEKKKKKKRGGEVKAKISHPAWYVGSLLNAVFGLEPCIWTPAHAS